MIMANMKFVIKILLQLTLMVFVFESFESFEITNYSEATFGCIYPCECPYLPSYINTKCTNPIVDQCGCCLICPRQLGERCNNDSQLCDISNGLVCKFKLPADLWGICTKLDGKQCFIDNQTYNHGESFKIDCRTQCICINGTYGCVSLCPQELIEPKGSCQNGRLIDVPNQCCREWMCDSQLSEIYHCNMTNYGEWSKCSQYCGLGTSTRNIQYFDQNELRCKTKIETRLCQIRECNNQYLNHIKKIKKRHKCKATIKSKRSQYFRLVNNEWFCESRKPFVIKYCSDCRRLHLNCIPIKSKTISVDFICDKHRVRTRRNRTRNRHRSYWFHNGDNGDNDDHGNDTQVNGGQPDETQFKHNFWSNTRKLTKFSFTNQSLVQSISMCKCFPV